MNIRFCIVLVIYFLYTATIMVASEQARDFVKHAGNGNVQQIKDMLQDGMNVNAIGSYRGTTALMAAVSGCQVTVIDVLLQHGASANQIDTQGDTAITRAVNACCRRALPLSILYDLVKSNMKSEWTRFRKFEKTPQEILIQLTAEAKRSQWITEKITLLAGALEVVAEGERATVAKKILEEQCLFPKQSVINNTILSYVSAYQESTQEQEMTLHKLQAIHKRTLTSSARIVRLPRKKYKRLTIC